MVVPVLLHNVPLLFYTAALSFLFAATLIGGINYWWHQLIR